MIIQCGKCSMKFRFDDALMRDEGVWIRCGLCQYEFFQSHPLALPDNSQARVSMPDAAQIKVNHRTETPDEPPAGNLTGPDVKRDKVILSSDGASTEKHRNMILEKRKGDKRENAAPQQDRSPRIMSILAVVFVAILVIAGMGFLTFPDIGRQVISDLSAYLPWIEPEEPPSIEKDIRLEAIGQRFVVNLTTGNLRIIEGMAVNQSGRSVARLQVKATLVDTQDNRLGEKQAYAGHVLSDAELMVLTEDEIRRRLNSPSGSTVSNDRILPGGRIPFMIVWAAEPPGAAKTFVAVVDVERLLQ